VSAPGRTTGDLAASAQAWRHSVQAALCDVHEPWAFGTVVRATRFPSYFHLNVVRVEEDPGMSVDALIEFADEALAGLDHRRVDIEPVEVAESLRGGFAARGWQMERLVLMLHDADRPSQTGGTSVEEVPHDAVHALRAAWMKESFPNLDPGTYFEEAREVARLLGSRAFAVLEAGTPVAYAMLEQIGRSAEIVAVYVRPDHRGRGLGTALTSAAIDAAGDVDELWIAADDEGRPKQLYRRLGFRPAWTVLELLQLPDPSGPDS
jgi:GNAT superfamily N-acetyltransferase